jgi:hypothetical protein
VLGSHKIGESYFSLTFDCHSHVTLCLKAFSKIIGISFQKVYSACHFVHDDGYHDGSFPIKIDKLKKESYKPKTDIIKTFLEEYWKNKTILADRYLSK